MEDLLDNYQPSDIVKQFVKTTPMLLLVGVSGAGKDSIKQKLLATNKFHNFVSYTTRLPRTNKGIPEQNHKDYHFVTRDEMRILLEKGEMIEAKLYSGNIYGTGLYDLEESVKTNKIALNDIEVQGVEEYKMINPKVNAVFILPPSFETWNARLMSRYSGHDIDEGDILLRLKTARIELKTALDSGYYKFIVNDDLDRAVEETMLCVEGNYSQDSQKHGEIIARKLLAELN
jgi:guanylate kinase